MTTVKDLLESVLKSLDRVDTAISNVECEDQRQIDAVQGAHDDAVSELEDAIRMLG